MQSLLHVAFHQPLGVALAGAVALAGLAATAALALLCFVKVVGLCCSASHDEQSARPRSTRLPACGPGWALLALLCVPSGFVPGLVVPTLAAPGARGHRRRV